MALPCSKNLISIIKRNSIKNNGNLFCLDCLHSFKIKNKLGSHKKVCKNKAFCNVIMPSEDTKILEFNQYLIKHQNPKNLRSLIKHYLLFMRILNV